MAHLNKKICKRCFQESKIVTDYDGVEIELQGKLSEDLWRKGFINCLFSKQGKRIRTTRIAGCKVTVVAHPINAGPPDECPYILEHVISRRKSK